MFDGLRNDANSSGFDEPVEYFPDDKPPVPAAPRPAARRKSSTKFLGMTPEQRFLISLLLMFAVCALGAMCMFVFGRFVLPF